MDRPINLNQVYGQLTSDEFRNPEIRAEILHLEHVTRKTKGGHPFGPGLMPWANLEKKYKDEWLQQAKESIAREQNETLPKPVPVREHT